MPFRLAALVAAFALAVGCGAQPEIPESEVADTEADAAEGVNTPAEGVNTPAEGVNTPAEGVNTPAEASATERIVVGLDGTWNIVMTPKGDGEVIRGGWKIEEDGDNRLIAIAGDAAIEVTERSEEGDAFSISGIVRTGDGPVPFETDGTLDGNTMEAEVSLEGMGDFALTGTRRAE